MNNNGFYTSLENDTFEIVPHILYWYCSVCCIESTNNRTFARAVLFRKHTHTKRYRYK